MFGKLKNKLKEWTKKISSQKEEIEKKPKIPSDKEIKKELENGNYAEPELKFEIGLQKTVPNVEKIEKKHFSIFSNKKTISEEEFDSYANELEMILLENNVALEIVDKILNELKQKIVGEEMNKKEIHASINATLKKIIEEILIEPFDIFEEINKKEGVYIMIFCGINGVGKTTQIAKIANMLKEKKISSVMAAADTFRAAALEQLKEHGEKLNIKVISHDYGADPSAVGFDAIKYAEKNNIKVVLIDTAGRMHTATNLLREMEKIKRVCKPDRTIFVGESITGNDSVDQIKAFNETIGIDAIFLTKADIDEKGGTALSVGYITKKPIIFLGTGQNYKDIEKFNKKDFLDKLGL